MYIEMLDILADFFPFLVPAIAILGLVAARTAGFESAKAWSESFFYGALVIVALGALRSMIGNESDWLIHTASLGSLIIGACIIAICSTQNAMAE